MMQIKQVKIPAADALELSDVVKFIRLCGHLCPHAEWERLGRHHG